MPINMIEGVARTLRRPLRALVSLVKLTPAPIDLSKLTILERTENFVRIRPKVAAEYGKQPPHLVKENHLVAKSRGPRFVHFLNHLFSKDRADKNICPVIFLPGILTSSNLLRIPTDGNLERLDDFKDLDRFHSAANVLAAGGLDLFLAQPPYCDRLYERYVDNILGVKNPTLPTLNFDDLVGNLKLYIDYVTHVSGSPKVILMGYSLGAMEMVAYQAVRNDPRVAGIINIAGPSNLGDQPTIKKLRAYNLSAGFLPATPFDPLKYLGKIFPWLTRVVLARMLRVGLKLLPRGILGLLPVLKNLYDFEHMKNKEKEGITFIKMLSYAIEAITPGMLEQMVEVMATDPRGFVSMDRKTDYLEEIKNITVPYLVIGGQADTLSPPENMQLGFDQIGTLKEEKQMEIIPETGHLDLLLRQQSMLRVAAHCLAFARKYGKGA